MDDATNNAQAYSPLAAGLASTLLAVNCLVLITSLWCVLVGPAGGVLLGAAGFLIAWLGCAITFIKGAGRGLVSYVPRLETLRVPLSTAFGLAALAAGACIAASFAVMRADGVPEGPASSLHVFAERPVYRLNNHGDLMVVSRARFVAAGTCFMVGWHSGAAAATLFALRRFLYGADN